MKLVFATQNKNKVEEIKKSIPSFISVKSLTEINCFDDIPETSDTLEGNAMIKANYVFNMFNVNCFADDTGLEVEALNGEPGVLSARYAGENKNSEDNINLLLDKLKYINNRKAQFRTVIALIINGKTTVFEGIVKGKISESKSGGDGFGYDPIFIPDGFSKSFAEMSIDEKNTISHRAIAFQKMIRFLDTI